MVALALSDRNRVSQKVISGYSLESIGCKTHLKYARSEEASSASELLLLQNQKHKDTQTSSKSWLINIISVALDRTLIILSRHA